MQTTSVAPSYRRRGCGASKQADRVMLSKRGSSSCSDKQENWYHNPMILVRAQLDLHIIGLLPERWLLEQASAMTHCFERVLTA